MPPVLCRELVTYYVEYEGCVNNRRFNSAVLCKSVMLHKKRCVNTRSPQSGLLIGGILKRILGEYFYVVVLIGDSRYSELISRVSKLLGGSEGNSGELLANDGHIVDRSAIVEVYISIERSRLGSCNILASDLLCYSKVNASYLNEVRDHSEILNEGGDNTVLIKGTRHSLLCSAESTLKELKRLSASYLKALKLVSSNNKVAGLLKRIEHNRRNCGGSVHHSRLEREKVCVLKLCGLVKNSLGILYVRLEVGINLIKSNHADYSAVLADGLNKLTLVSDRGECNLTGANCGLNNSVGKLIKLDADSLGGTVNRLVVSGNSVCKEFLGGLSM